MNKSGFARVDLVLSFLGLYIAAMLSLSHLLGIQLPCGTGSGCGLVTNDRHSFLLGLPIAYYGLAAYLAFLGLSIARLFAPRFHPRRLHALGYLAAFIGVLVSIGLTLYSTRVLHAVCAWCIGSAITMSLLLVSHALEASQPVNLLLPRRSATNAVMLVVLTMATGVALSAAVKTLRRGETVDRIVRRNDPAAPHLAGLSDEELLPPGVHIEGPENAKTVLVMFGDLTCPVCQEAYNQFSALLRRRHDFRFAFRHLPLRMHPYARLAALLSELAAEKGRFWAFATATYRSEADSAEAYEQVAVPFGISLSEAKRRTANEQDPAYSELRIDDDETAKLRLDTTPTLYLVAEGFNPARTSMTALEAMLDDIARQRASHQ